MHIEARTVAVVLVLQLIIARGGSNPEQRYSMYSGVTGGRDVVSSAGFPGQVYSDNRIHTYRFKSESNGFVRLIFSDFILHRKSILKIYDGYDNKAPCSVWRLSTRPVFQSTSSYLYVVFKTGKFSKNGDEFYGWRMVAEYVSESRDVWATEPGIPKRGSCPKFRSSTLYLGTYRSSQNLDCAWNLNFNGKYREGHILAVVTTQYSNLTITVHDGATSQHPTRENYRLKKGPNYIINYYNVMRSDYLKVTGDMVTGASVKMAHGVNEDSALKAALAADGRQSACEYKDCAQIEDSKSATCVLYWNTCGDPSNDASCETNTALHCGATSQCYDKDDECDGFYDCGGDTETADDELTSKCGRAKVLNGGTAMDESTNVEEALSSFFALAIACIVLALLRYYCKYSNRCDVCGVFGRCLRCLLDCCLSPYERCTKEGEETPPPTPPLNRQGLLQAADWAPADDMTDGTGTPLPDTTDAVATTVHPIPSVPSQISLVVDTEDIPPAYEVACASSLSPISPDPADPELPSYEEAIEMEANRLLLQRNETALDTTV